MKQKYEKEHGKQSGGEGREFNETKNKLFCINIWRNGGIKRITINLSPTSHPFFLLLFWLFKFLTNIF